MSKTIYLLIYSQIREHQRQSRHNMPFGTRAADLMSDLFEVVIALMEAKRIGTLNRLINKSINLFTYLSSWIFSEMQRNSAAMQDLGIVAEDLGVVVQDLGIVLAPQRGYARVIYFLLPSYRPS